MDELKQNDEWSQALRQISGQRDRLLGSVPSISPARRASLKLVLAREFPVEAALRETTARRDQLLVDFPREIACSVATNLRRGLTTAQRSDGRSLPSWPNLLTGPFLLAACLIMGLGIVFLGKWGPLPAGSRDESMAHRPIDRSGPPPSHQLSLRMSGAELASLRATFLAANHIPNEDAAVPTRLRLDLPVRALFSDDGIAGTP